MQQDTLDQKVTRVFAGKVVRKDLLHQIKGGENVPSYVLEYLLGKYCASDNQEEIRIGIDAVKETLAANYFRHDEANKAQSMVEQKGRHRFIDRVEVRFLAGENKYWASMDHFGYTRIHIPEEFYRRYERLLEGGIWAIVDVEFRPPEEGSPTNTVPSIRGSKRAKTAGKTSASATMASVMPCTAMDRAGIGIPGRTKRSRMALRYRRAPCSRTAPTEIIRSCVTSKPVVSVSITVTGKSASCVEAVTGGAGGGRSCNSRSCSISVLCAVPSAENMRRAPAWPSRSATLAGTDPPPTVRKSTLTGWPERRA